MKKTLHFSSTKFFMVVFFLFVLGGIAFLSLNVFANEPLSIIEIKSNSYNGNAILYSDDRLLYWSSDSKNTEIKENIKKFDMANWMPLVYLTKDNKLYKIRVSENNDVLISDDAVDFGIPSGNTYKQFIVYKDSANNLYAVCGADNTACSGYFDVNNKLIATNVKDFYVNDADTDSSHLGILYTDLDNNLYAIGFNIYGDKINEGNYLMSFTKILENVKEFSPIYALTYADELYDFSPGYSRPTLVMENVDEVIIESNYANMADLDRNFGIKLKDNSYLIGTKNNFGNMSFRQIQYSIKKINSKAFLTEEGDYYLLSGSCSLQYCYTKIDENVDDIYQLSTANRGPESAVSFINTNAVNYYLKDNKLYGNMLYSYSWSDNFYDSLVHYSKKDTSYALIKNVASIEYMSNGFILLNDNSVLRFGTNRYYQFIDSSLPTSYVPIQLNERINNDREITSKQMNLSYTGDLDVTVGDTTEMYAVVLPFNAVNRDVTWTSSNENVATVSSDGLVTYVGVGTVTIKAKIDGTDLEEEQTFTVHPIPKGIEFANGASANLERYQRILLTANVLPADTIKTKVNWAVSDKDHVVLTTYITDLSEYDYITASVGTGVLSSVSEVLGDAPSALAPNQAMVYVTAGGTYTVTAYTYDNTYSATFTINTVEKVNSISLNIPSSNYDGAYNAYIYLSESNTLNVEATALPTTATNKKLIWESSDPSIAEVSQTGVITGKKVGRTRITVKSEDGGSSRSFYLMVYDYTAQGQTIKGDVNGDGTVDILDLIKLRRYLAGLEELE